MLDVLVLTFKLPAVIVHVSAIPKTELADKVSEVPLIVTLKRFAVPFRFDALVNVAVPAVAKKLPLTSNEFAIVNDVVADNVPDAANAYNPMAPAPVIVLAAPFIVIVPAVAVNDPETARLPETINELAVVIVPPTVRFDKFIFAPLIIFEAPVILIVPPALCVNCPLPVVNKLPDTERLLVALAIIFDTVIVRLLKLCMPVPLIIVLAPIIVMVLVDPVKVPLLIQSPARL